jgi:hypothetical protein
MLLNRARRLTYFFLVSVIKMTCNSAHEQNPLSNDTIDSVLRHREVGRAKDLSATPRNAFWNVTQCSLLKLIDFSEKPAGI